MLKHILGPPGMSCSSTWYFVPVSKVSPQTALYGFYAYPLEEGSASIFAPLPLEGAYTPSEICN